MKPSPRARVLRIGWIGFMVVALVLSAVPASAAKSRGRRYRLPVTRRLMPDRKIANRHHDYPAWDLAVPKKTPVRAVHAGRVRSVTRWGACGRGVIIRGRDGFEYTYCHGSWVFAKKRRWVQAGQKIMLSGSTGHSTGPHLHLQIKGPRGGLLCPQPLLKRWARGKQVSPRATTARGCAYSADRPMYRSPPRGRRPGRATTGRRAKTPDRKKSDRRKPGRRKSGHKKPGRKKPGRKKPARKKPARRREADRRGRREGGPGSHRRRRQREAERRRRARAYRDRVRRETAARRADLALSRRVRPLI